MTYAEIIGNMNTIISNWTRMIAGHNFQPEFTEKLVKDYFAAKALIEDGEDFEGKAELKKNFGFFQGILSFADEEIAQYYGCKPEQIAYVDVNAFDIARKNYKVIFGDARFNYDYNDDCDVKVISGTANFNGSDITDLCSLEIVGNLKIEQSNIEDFGNLKNILGAVDVANSESEKSKLFWQNFEEDGLGGYTRRNTAAELEHDRLYSHQNGDEISERD